MSANMRTFLADEAGAVTVDWTVVTAGTAAVALAMLALVAGGSEEMSNDIVSAFDRIELPRVVGELMAEYGFDGGDRGDWTAGRVRDVEGFGEILVVPRRGVEASLPIDVGDHAFAVVEFDMIFGDSWDNETGTISIAGEEVVVGTHAWRAGEPDIRVIEGDNDTRVTLTRASKGTGNFRRRGNSTDYTYRVQVVAANDGGDLSLGASTTLNSGVRDEFFGIDNVTVTGTDRR